MEKENPDKLFESVRSLIVLGVLSIAGSLVFALPGLILAILGLTRYKRYKVAYLTDRERFKEPFTVARKGFYLLAAGLALSLLALAAALLYSLDFFNPAAA